MIQSLENLLFGIELLEFFTFICPTLVVILSLICFFEKFALVFAKNIFWKENKNRISP
jgi:hypothetical protein